MGWSTIEICTRYGVQFLVVLLLARLLTPSDFGLIAMLLVFTSVGALLVDSGFSTSLIQRQRTTADDETTVFWFTCGMSVLLFLALWFTAPVIAEFYQQGLLLPLTRLVAWILPLSALSAVPDAILTQQLRFKARAKAEAIGVLGSAVVAVSLAWGGYGVWSLAWQIVTAATLRAILLWIYSGWRPNGRLSPTSFRSLFRFGSYMFLANLLNMASLRLQSLLIGKLFAADALGYYTLAQNVQQTPAFFMNGILNRVGLPIFSGVADQAEKLLVALRFSLRIALFLFVPCIVGIAVIAKPLIIALYGIRWAPAAPLLTVLSLSAILWPLHVLNLAAIGARGRSDLIFHLEVLKRVVSISLIITGSRWGAIGIAWSVLASSLFAAVTNTWYSRKLLGYGVAAQFRDQVGTVLLTACAAATGWAVLHWMVMGVPAMLLAIMVAALTYLGGAVISHNKALEELLQLWRAMAVGSQHRANDPPGKPGNSSKL